MSKKITEKEIKLRQAKKLVQEATPYSCAVQMMQALQNYPALSAVIGLSIAEILKAIENGTAPKTKEFSNFAAVVCNDKQNDFHRLYPNDFTKPFPPAGLLIYVFQIMNHAELATGINASLTPSLVDDKITVDIHTEPEKIAITPNGVKYTKDATAGSNLFSDAQRYTQTFINLALDAVASMIKKYEEKA